MDRIKKMYTEEILQMLSIFSTILCI